MKYSILTFLFLSSCSWKTMDFSDSRHSKIGKCEEVSTFIYMPIECPDGKSYWLQKMKVRRCYDVTNIFSGIVEHDSCEEKK